MARGILARTVVIAAASPARAVALAADAAGAGGRADRIKGRLEGVSGLAYILTTLLWVLVLWRGILYPVFGGAKDLAASWGGPTLAGAWAAHLGLTVAALFVVSFVLALGQSGSRPP